MKWKRLVFWGAIAAAVLATAGCEWTRWLRLLSLKKQLADVDRYVKLDEKDGLTLRFLKPVVYADDLSLLMSGETSRITNGNQVAWLSTYRKQSLGTNAEAGRFDLWDSLVFENQKFTELRFPARFLVLLPKPLILGFLRSVGQAEVDLKHGTVKARWVGAGPHQKVELPSKAQITAMLGAPFTITESNRTRTFLYKYYQDVSDPQSPADRLVWARFTFTGADEQVVASEGVIGNVGWSMTRVNGQAEPHITFELVPLSVEPVAIKLSSELGEEYVGRYQGSGGVGVNIGRDGQVFAASWTLDKGGGGWCLALPELTNVLFGLPSGGPRFTFLRDNGGAVTGLVAELKAAPGAFAKFTNQLPAGPAEVKVAADAYQACAGRYKGSWGGIINIRRRNEQLWWEDPGCHARLPLYAASETNFFFKAVESPLTFVKNPDGEVTKFVLHYNGHAAEATKLKEQ